MTTNNPSHGRLIDELLHDYLHSEEMRQRVETAALASDAAVKGELTRHVHTGKLLSDSSAEVNEFDSGWGMMVTALWYGFFNFNKRGTRRLREPGYRRGAGIRRKRGYKVHSPFMLVDKPSIIGEAVEMFGHEIDIWDGK